MPRHATRHGLEIGMVSGVVEAVLPNHFPAADQKSARHGPGIAYRLAARIALSEGLDGAQPDGRTEEFAQAPGVEVEGAVKPLLGIANGPGLRPEGFKELLAVRLLAQMKEEDPRKTAAVLGGLAQVSDRFATKRSAEVAQKDQQVGFLSDFSAQRGGPQIAAPDGHIQNERIDVFGAHLCYRRRLRCCGFNDSHGGVPGDQASSLSM